MGVLIQVATDDIRLNLELRGERQVQRGLNQTGNAAQRAGGALEDMGDQAAEAGRRSDRAGNRFRGTAQDLSHVRREAERARTSYARLLREFDRTGDRSLLRDLGRARRDSRRFGSLAGDLPGEDEGERGLGSRILGGITSAAQNAGPAKLAIAGIGIAAAPLIGSAVAAAVLGGIGAGGIIGGISLVAGDPRVVEAGKALKEALGGEFGSHGAAEPFVAPLLDSMNILSAAAKETSGEAREAFATIAPVLRPLTLGLTGFVDKILPGLTHGLEGAKPVLRAIGEILPELGQGFGDFIDKIATDSDGAVLALKALADITVELLGGFGNIIYGLQGIYEWTVRSTAAATDWAEELLGGGDVAQVLVGGFNDKLKEHLGLLDRSKDSSGDFVGSLDNIGESAEQSAQKIADLKKGIEDLFGLTMSLDQATLAYKRGFADLNKELTEGKRTLDLNTEAGQDNEEAVLRRIQQLEDLREANANSNMGIDAANRLYEKHIEQLRRTLLNLGYNKAEVNALIDRYKAIPKSVETTIGIILKTQGSESAWTALRKAERQAEERNAPLHAGGRASGGPVTGGKTYWVGENGPELVTFGDSGYVHNAAASRAMTSGASGGSSMPMGTQVIRLEIDVRGDDEDQVRRLRKQIKVLGGGNVQVALGEN